MHAIHCSQHFLAMSMGAFSWKNCCHRQATVLFMPRERKRTRQGACFFPSSSLSCAPKIFTKSADRKNYQCHASSKQLLYSQLLSCSTLKYFAVWVDKSSYIGSFPTKLPKVTYSYGFYTSIAGLRSKNLWNCT